jgi:hypothetical protein
MVRNDDETNLVGKKIEPTHRNPLSINIQPTTVNEPKMIFHSCFEAIPFLYRWHSIPIAMNAQTCNRGNWQMCDSNINGKNAISTQILTKCPNKPIWPVGLVPVLLPSPKSLLAGLIVPKISL